MNKIFWKINRVTRETSVNKKTGKVTPSVKELILTNDPKIIEQAVSKNWERWHVGSLKTQDLERYANTDQFKLIAVPTEEPKSQPAQVIEAEVAEE